MVQEDHCAARTCQLLEDDHLVGIVTSQTVRGIDEDGCKGALGREIPSPLEAGAVQPGSAVTVIDALPLQWDLITVFLGGLT
jgi:hypothetical protein